MFRSDYKGTGNMTNFCEESNKLFAALNNIQFQMPIGYSGIEPRVEIFDDKIVFDFGDALVFTLNNVQWNLEGDASFVSNEVTVDNGQLVITVVATTA